jgi:hypothetical protein
MKEILINTIFVDSSGNILTTPVGCPREGDTNLIMQNGITCCIYTTQTCPYLDSISYSMKENKKTLFCKSE